MKAYKIISEDTERLPVLLALSALLLAVVIQAVLNSGGTELPQKSADSILKLISDDTRMVLSQTMMGKMDEYFHGGVKAENCTLENAAEPAAHGEEGHQCDEPCGHAEKRLSGFHPVAWINANIHAQEHRHLAGQRAVEMLPWVVAASRTSPHNIQAYEAGSYILNRMTENPQVAVDFLKEGIRNNPDNSELEVSLAEIYFSTLKDKPQAAAGFERALIKSLARKRELSDEDLLLRLKIYFYIGLIAKESNDINKLREVFQRAQELKKENVMTQSLATWLKEAESRKRE